MYSKYFRSLLAVENQNFRKFRSNSKAFGRHSANLPPLPAAQTSRSRTKSVAESRLFLPFLHQLCHRRLSIEVVTHCTPRLGLRRRSCTSLSAGDPARFLLDKSTYQPGFLPLADLTYIPSTLHVYKVINNSIL